MSETTNKQFLDKNGLVAFWNKIMSTVTNIITSKLEEHLSTIDVDLSIHIAWSDLVALRNNSQLTPGKKYRIIDYVTTTTQENTQSAGHQFDVIVTADDVNVLNENARAIQHEGDTYFANSDLNAWELKYCLDNDTNRFAWADAENGEGVIYRMIDEWNNECPYDFKNIIHILNKSFMYNQWGVNSEFVRYSSIDKVINGTLYYGYVTYTVPIAWSQGKCWVTDENVTDNSQLYNEDGSQISYGGTIFHVNNTVSESYTFNEGSLNDFSLEGEFCHKNTILAWVGGINKIVFKNDKTQDYHSCYNNSFGVNCYSNSFGNNCYNNSFGNGCDYNSLGDSCYSNSFGEGCDSNSFGNSCYENSFGNSCGSNSFGNDCFANSFGNGCYDNSFGNSCGFNSFGNNCGFNSFGDDCGSNSFGNSCGSNSFGNSCGFNSFGNNCGSNSFGNECFANSFGNGCYDNSFGNYCSYNSFGNYCSYNSFGESRTNPKSYYRYIIFDDGNKYINLNCTTTTSSSKYYQNVRIGLGVNNTTTYKTINDSNVKQTYETLYKPANSQTITV